MSRFNTRFNTRYNIQDRYPLFYGRPVDDPDDYDCHKQDHPVPASRLLDFIHYMLLTIGALFFGFIATLLAWLGICTKHGYQSRNPPNIVHKMGRMNHDPQAEGYHIPPRTASTPIKSAPKLSIAAIRSNPGLSVISYKTYLRKLPCVPPTPSVLNKKRRNWDEKELVDFIDTLSRRKKRCQDPEPVLPAPKPKSKNIPRQRRKTSQCRSAVRNKGCTWVCAYTFVTTQLVSLLALNLTSFNIAWVPAQALLSFNATAASGTLELPPTEDMEDII
ncbi:hypothetical protein BG006_006005 [Podila minutissima]|uniref:Uncharacterized protein n=1 Tax=Podila minutissima TaxID=64525 RepID=A0A9P5VLQ3_9FUNG|nr:hypothetical protein BG006_006005 [Podila minutissima]